MNYDFEISLDLNEFDVRLYLRDSTDLFIKSLKNFSGKSGKVAVCKFYEYGYPQEWKRIMKNLWSFWEVKNYDDFTSRMEELTSQDREQMIEEIARAEIIGILRQQS